MFFLLLLNAGFNVLVGMIYIFSHGHKLPGILRNVISFCGVTGHILFTNHHCGKQSNNLKKKHSSDAFKIVESLKLKNVCNEHMFDVLRNVHISNICN